MSPVGPPCVILTRRRTGAGDIYKLLGNHMPWPRRGNEPFLWTRSMGEVSRMFHQGQPELAEEQLDAELSLGVFFKHQLETESWPFNTVLLRQLEAHRYRVIHIDRESEDERLFSMVVANHFSTWAQEGIESLRDHLRRSEPAPKVDLERVRSLVHEEAGYRRWIDEQMPKYRLERLAMSYEAFFRNGLKALPLADELFAFAGLGARASILDDASLLRFIFKGEHYTLGLMEYSADLRGVHQLIQAELAAAAERGA